MLSLLRSFFGSQRKLSDRRRDVAKRMRQAALADRERIERERKERSALTFLPFAF
jgi:hypothetical protein